MYNVLSVPFFPHNQNGMVHHLSDVMTGRNIQTDAFISYTDNIIDN